MTDRPTREEVEAWLNPEEDMDSWIHPMEPEEARHLARAYLSLLDESEGLAEEQAALMARIHESWRHERDRAAELEQKEIDTFTKWGIAEHRADAAEERAAELERLVRWEYDAAVASERNAVDTAGLGSPIWPDLVRRVADHFNVTPGDPLPEPNTPEENDS